MRESTINQEQVGRVLLGLARQTLEDDLAGSTAVPPSASWLQEPAATFVTLHRQGELRGCIGSMQAYRPLADDLRANARAAAFRDPRFPPLEQRELQDLEIEVSLLSSLEPMSFESEEDLIRQIRPGVDGLLLEYEFRRGTFLPAVWASLPETRLFLAKLKAKAGLGEDFWSADLAIQRYTTETWSETQGDR